MAKDPAFLYYDGDASKDMAHMNRLERGGYIDLIHAQKKFGKLLPVLVKKVLGNDYENIWPAIEPVMTYEDGRYYIEWVQNSIEKRQEHAKRQKENIAKRWNNKKDDTTVIPSNNHGNTTVIPLVNENENKEQEPGNTEVSKDPVGMKKVKECANKAWADQLWRESLCMGCTVSEPDLKKWMAQFNSSVSNDHFSDFDVGRYKKLFRGWLNKERDKGTTLTTSPTTNNGLPNTLKRL